MNHVNAMKQAMDAFEQGLWHLARDTLRTAIAQAEKAEQKSDMSYGMEILNWNRSQKEPPIAISKELFVAKKLKQIYSASPAMQKADPSNQQFITGPCGQCKSSSSPCYCSDAANLTHSEHITGKKSTTVPTFNGSAIRKLADLQAKGWKINGYHIQRQDGDTWKHGAITSGGMVLWWQPEVRKAALEEAVRLLQSRDMGDCTREDAEALRCALAVRSLIEKKSA